MKNIHVLPTDKPSRLFEDDLQLYYSKDKNRIGSKLSNKNIYITSDEEIKEGDWIIDDENDILEVIEIERNQGLARSVSFTYVLDSCKKIILTTDQDLIKDGVQAIPDEFLEWFVKNSSCEEVIVEEFTVKIDLLEYKTNYKIIIPKEEPKNPPKQDIMFHEEREEYFYETIINNKKIMVWLGKTYSPKEETNQETLEEAALKCAENCNSYESHLAEWGFLEGAKWQQERSYSEKEVIELLNKREDCINKTSSIFDYTTAKEWLEKFKKK